MTKFEITVRFIVRIYIGKESHCSLVVPIAVTIYSEWPRF